MKKANFTPRRQKRDKGDSNTSTESKNGKDPVHVFSRIRPLSDGNENSCIQLDSPKILTISAPSDTKIIRKDIQYKFKHIFTSYSSQKEIFDTTALPLLEDLLHGKNGLLFTYGITGSGKTYTLTGGSDNPGIMPRCITTLFNTIGEHQTPRYVIKSDKMNGFEVQTENDALEDRNLDLRNKNKFRTPSKERIVYANDEMKITDFNEANLYSVFISYVEVYNNVVYDLLDSTKTLQNKMIREDAYKNMYVNGAVEVEVKNAMETFELFNVGQKRKRMGNTQLNSESSRSHSIFSIRVVQLFGSHDDNGEHVIPESNLLKISQLCLVDLAGSERCNRTQTTGARLKEASCINNSLMTLRSCIEILRENQISSANRLVPYRDSRLTHLFKNYFEGEGRINMIICIHPSERDYEENLHVLKFAEMSQEVKVTRAEGRYTPYSIKKRPVLAPKPSQTPSHKIVPINLFPPFTIGPQLPSLKIDINNFEGMAQNLGAIAKALDMRHEKLISENDQFLKRAEKFREQLRKRDEEFVLTKTDNNNLKAILKKLKHKSGNVQTKMVDLENENVALNTKIIDLQNVVKTLQETIDEKNLKINQNMLERQKHKHKFVKQQEKFSQELDDKLRKQRQHLENKYHVNNDKLQKVHEIIHSKGVNNDNLVSPDADVQTQTDLIDEPSTPNARSMHRRNVTLTMSTNGKRRRSRSVGEVWLEHNVIKPVALGTVLQPSMKKRKSLTKLTKASDVTNPNQNRYCLIAQEPDVDGELETKLYKGDIVPTCSGGAQVIFNDVERLKQESPSGTPH